MIERGLSTDRTTAGAATLAGLPILAALLLLAVHRQQVAEAGDWPSLFGHLLAVTLAAAPLLGAHLLTTIRPRASSLAVWALVVIAYPFMAGRMDDGPLSSLEWLVVSAASAASLFLERRSSTHLLDTLKSLPLSLDGVVLGLLALWTLAASSLFIATPDPVENQPLSVWFDGQRILDHPGLFASYLGQFALVAGTIYGFYWLCRHLLVRRILQRHGWTSFFAASLALWLVYTPLACTLVLTLPLNTADWSLIPSETANPFLAANYRFATIVWVLVCPLILASERLLALANAADVRHAQVRAELQLLQQQVNPHFLFNTLNTLYALCLKDNAASAQAIVKLSDLLRYSVYEVADDWVPLDGEVAHLRNYLDLQLLRFAAHCRIEARWPDDADGRCVPPQMLIMLVENMFKHGVERSAEPVTLRLDLAVEGRRIIFCCTNSPGADSGADTGPGLGLANLRRRLELLCGDDFLLESGPSDEGWTARLELGSRPC